MRLIVTMGATGIKHKHTYIINGKEYKKELSFLAIAEAYKINDIVVIGTNKSKESIQSILSEYNNIKMVVIESNNVEDVFQTSLEYIKEDTIFDLTQGFRHYPMLTLLASIFVQSDKSKNIKDIFYAQVLDESCQAYKESCTYKFVSLIKYLDIANMARIINTFNKTLLTLDYKVQDTDFSKLQNLLIELTKELFSNNFKKSKQKAEDIEAKIETILKNGELDIVKEHLNNLKKEMKQIQVLTSENESEMLLKVSEYFLSKDILLHSVTLLYESMVAFLDENVNNNKCNTVVNKRGKEVASNTFQRRNCLKLNMSECHDRRYSNNISKCKAFSALLRKIDGFRNTSAHAHTTGSYQADLKQELKEAINFLSPIVKTNVTVKEKLLSLTEQLNSRF